MLIHLFDVAAATRCYESISMRAVKGRVCLPIDAHCFVANSCVVFLVWLFLCYENFTNTNKYTAPCRENAHASIMFADILFLNDNFIDTHPTLAGSLIYNGDLRCNVDMLVIMVLHIMPPQTEI